MRDPLPSPAVMSTVSHSPLLLAPSQESIRPLGLDASDSSSAQSQNSAARLRSHQPPGTIMRSFLRVNRARVRA